ncbi:MAG TPA: Maf family protein [Chthoniobacterales bacterium]
MSESIERVSASRLVLASGSPRRRELLAEAGIEAVCEPTDVEELTVADGPPYGLALANAELKAMSIALSRPDRIVLGADTIVVFEGDVYGKPRDHDHAFEMLSRLVGHVHEVITGVCLVEWGRTAMVKFHEVTRVRFKRLSAEEIQAYLASIDPLDKAGAYAAQEDDGRIIECLEGSFSNVVGLPIERVREALVANFPGELA